MTSSISSSSSPVLPQQKSRIELREEKEIIRLEESIQDYKEIYETVRSNKSRKYPYGKGSFFRELIDEWDEIQCCELNELWKSGNFRTLNPQSKYDLVKLILTVALEENFSFPSCIYDPISEVIQLLNNLDSTNLSPHFPVNKIIIHGHLYANVDFFQIVYLCWEIYCNSTSAKTEHKNDLAKLILIMALKENNHFVSSSMYNSYDPFSKNDLSLVTLNLFKDLYNSGASPNILINEITFNNKSFKEIEFFQIVYLYWKTYSENPLSVDVNQGFNNLCQEMIRDPRTDLKVQFFESQNASPHFVPQTDLHATGYTFESTTLAHYALAIKDHTFAMLMINSNKRLLLSKCTLISESMKRITSISLLHIAARTGNTGSCCFLIGKDPNSIFEKDSSQNTPFAYLQRSYQDGLVRPKTVSKLSGILTPESSVQENLLPSASQTIIRPGYAILYNLAFKTAYYVYERLTLRSMPSGDGKRDGHSFLVERSIPEMHRGSSTDFTNSEYDRGHLAPAADFTHDSDIADSFILSNICPQKRELNRGLWKKLEALVRLKRLENDAVDVYTGPIFDLKKQPFEQIGKNELPVPTHFFKIIHLHNHKSTETIVYKFPNRVIEESEKLEDFRSTLKKIQKLTGVPFTKMTRPA